MSRSVKDLRELICISRLSVRSSGSDQESDESGQDYDESYDRHTDPASQQHGGQATLPKELTGYSNEILSAITRKTSEKKNVVASMKSPRSARSSSSREIVVGRPKSAVGGVRRPPSSLDCELHSTSSTKGFDKFGSMNLNRKNFYEAANCRKKPDEVEVSRAKKMENMLQYIDATVVSSLLENCNIQLKEISMWLRTEQNFVSLANFLMTKFHYKKRKELFEMETSFILDELHVAFGVGIRDKKVKTVDLKDLLNVILREYPSKMLGRKGLIWFVQTIETFCCGKDESFRQLLSDVSLSTQNKQHIQWLLGMRAFSLVSLANGVIYFYKNICQLEAKREEGTAMKTLSSISDLKQVWLDAALEHDYLEVLEYLLQSLDKSQEIMDKIIFKSAIYGSERILTDFIQKVFIITNDKILEICQLVMGFCFFYNLHRHSLQDPLVFSSLPFRYSCRPGHRPQI